jgi:hypothetical protein
LGFPFGRVIRQFVWLLDTAEGVGKSRQCDEKAAGFPSLSAGKDAIS